MTPWYTIVILFSVGFFVGRIHLRWQAGLKQSTFEWCFMLLNLFSVLVWWIRDVVL